MAEGNGNGHVQAGTIHQIVHTYDRQPAPIKVKLERNSRGYNWEVSVEGEDLDTCLAQLREANGRLQAEYGKVE